MTRAGKKKKIGRKVNALLMAMVAVTMLLAGGVGSYSLYSMKKISVENGRMLGETAAEDAEKALEEMAIKHLQDIAVEKATYIEEKFAEVEAYVRGIAAQAADIYHFPEKYPDREVALPVQGSTRLAAQLLWSERLDKFMEEGESFPEELLKLGNLQDLLVQYNANNDMVNSVYVATESGWMIQADYIAYSKYKGGMPGEMETGEPAPPMPYEANDRQWYQLAGKCQEGQIVYTDVLRDFHQGGDCIVCASPIFQEGKLVAVAGVGSYLETVNRAVLNTTIGKEGYAFLINEKGQVMVSGRTDGETAPCAHEWVDLRESDNRALAETASDMVKGLTGFRKLTLDGREVYLAYAPLQTLGWSFATVIGVAEIISPAQESQKLILALTEDVAVRQDDAIRKMLLSLLGMLAVAIPMICLLGTLFSGRLTEPIRSLTSQVAKIDGGNLDCRICIATGDEVEELGNAFNSMTEQIREYVDNLAAVTAEKERIRTEIQVASRLQADMLPDAEGAFADRSEFQLFASMMPARGVGGDFYDFFLLDEDHLALVMADVSGKGVPAALFMVVSRTLIRGHLSVDTPLEQTMEEINNSLCENSKNDMFVTAWIGILTLSTGELSFVNAGHCWPLVKGADGDCRYETARGGFVLAGMEDMSYQETRIRLRQGDTLLLYTDGVTEAINVEKKLYGEERLKEVMQKSGSRTPEELLQEIWRNVDLFQKGMEQADDITMLAVVYQGDSVMGKEKSTSGEGKAASGDGSRDFTTKSDVPEVGKLREFAEFVENLLRDQGVSGSTIGKLQMAVDEILSNICYYSGAKEMTLGVRVEKCGQEKNRMVTLLFQDDGVPYNPLDRPDPDVGELPENRKEGGLGIYLVKKRMDQVIYDYVDGRNCLTITKKDGEDNV